MVFVARPPARDAAHRLLQQHMNVRPRLKINPWFLRSSDNLTACGGYILYLEGSPEVLQPRPKHVAKSVLERHSVHHHGPPVMSVEVNPLCNLVKTTTLSLSSREHDYYSYLRVITVM